VNPALVGLLDLSHKADTENCMPNQRFEALAVLVVNATAGVRSHTYLGNAQFVQCSPHARGGEPISADLYIDDRA
jgi:hypothetical protein